MVSDVTPLLTSVIGLLLLGAVLQDAFEVMLLPRRVKRRWRLTRYFFNWTWRLWSLIAGIVPADARRERFLGIYGSLAMTLLFSFWAIALILAFGLLQWAAQHWHGAKPASDLAEQIYLSGVTFFTLGYGDVVPHTPPARILAVVEAGVGFGLIAVVIGYLPVLYQLFSRREAHVLQLDARAGSPPSPIVLLRRHAESGGLDKIDDLLRTWEIWGAELLESHLSYPMLAYYRSQHHDQSWLAALAAIMDTCALILIGVEELKQLQARMTFAMARQVVVEMARSLEVSGRSDAPNRFPPEDFDRMLEAFKEAGLTWNGGEAAPQTLAAVRATYEPVVQALAEYLLIPLSGWVAARDTPDHWERGVRGIIASRLISGLADGSISEASAAADSKRGGWVRRVRRRQRPRQ
ncbi:MAG: ion channel [Pseudomonadota bacterium]|nr:ion channel [Pseudomonadota bacterium]